MGSERSSGIWLIFAAAALVVASLAFAAGAQAKKRVTVPATPKKQYNARLASTGDDLWIAVVGSGAWGDYLVRVSRYMKGRWVPLPGAPKTLNSEGIQIAAIEVPGAASSRPCIGDSPRRVGRIRCFTGETWAEVPLPAAVEGMALTGLRGDGDHLTALFTAAGRPSSEIRLVRTDGETATTMGPPLGLDGEIQADLGEVTAGTGTAAIDVGIQVVSSPGYGRRSLATLERDAWSVDPLPKETGGPQMSGPVRTGQVVLFPVVAGHDSFGLAVRNWPFWVFRRESGRWSRVKISRASGANVGGIFAVGRRVWAEWGRAFLTKKRGLDFRLNATRLSADGGRIDRRLALRSGPDSDSSLMQAVRFRRRPVFLYMSEGPRGSRMNVRFSK